jgi:hypothetical protein
VLLRPLSLADPGTLIQVYETEPRTNSGLGFDGRVVFQDFTQWRTQSRLLQGIATYSSSTRNLQGVGELDQVPIIFAERGLLGLLGVSAWMGQTFGEHDPPNVAVTSYGFWEQHLGGDPSPIGRAIALDEQHFTLIGVVPEAFRFR